MTVPRWHALSLVLLIASPALAQYGSPYGGVQQNPYNRTNQPLSPYLNLFRNNPATNYYYGVRPGTQAGGMLQPFSGGVMQQRPVVFFPGATTAEEAELREPIKEKRFAPTGHGSGFGNTTSFFNNTNTFGALPMGPTPTGTRRPGANAPQRPPSGGRR